MYVDRTYEQPVQEIIRYVPIEQAPVSRPDAPTVSGPETGSFLQQGDAVFKQGRYDEARRLYTRALLADESDPAARLSYAYAHFALGRCTIAAMALRRALAGDPGLMDTPPDPRMAYGVGGEFEKHLAALREHVVLAPEDTEAILLLVYVAHAIGQTELALGQLDRVLAADDADTLAYVLRDAILHSRTAPERQPAPPTEGITPPA